MQARINYRIVEHPADIGIEADGATAGEALSAAAQGLACIVTGRDDLHGIRPDGEAAFEVKAPDREALAVAFLSEVLWLLESQGALWLDGGADVEPGRDWAARARGNVVVYDPALHGRGTEVKAVTYHRLRFERDGARWHVRVVLDI